MRSCLPHEDDRAKLGDQNLKAIWPDHMRCGCSHSGRQSIANSIASGHLDLPADLPGCRMLLDDIGDGSRPIEEPRLVCAHLLPASARPHSGAPREVGVPVGKDQLGRDVEVDPVVFSVDPVPPNEVVALVGERGGVQASDQRHVVVLVVVMNACVSMYCFLVRNPNTLSIPSLLLWFARPVTGHRARCPTATRCPSARASLNRSVPLQRN
jgi:hypothetical protein